jgi:Omp85 superfamily domain
LNPRIRWVAACAATFALSISPRAHAQPATGSPQPSTPAPAAADDANASAAADDDIYLPEGRQTPLDSDAERTAPDYDNRGDDPTTAGDVLLWAPRIVFSPLYLISEYVIRRPAGALTTFIESENVVKEVEGFLTFGPNGNYGIIPSGLIDFGFRPSIGLYFFGDDVGNAEGLGLRSHVAFGGVGFYRATGSVRYVVDKPTFDTFAKHLQIKGVYSRRPDWAFWGLGPESDDSDKARYTARHVEGLLSYEGDFWRSSHLSLRTGVRDVDFQDEACCGNASIGERVAAGSYPLPELFSDGYLIGHAGLEATIDTRPRRFHFEGAASDYVSPSGTGVKLDLRGTLATGLRRSTLNDGRGEARPLFARYGGTFGAYVDLFRQRVLGAQVIVDFADPLQDDRPIPFTELVSLGGSRPLRGFLARRLLGRSSAVGQIDYSWPIWVFLDGVVHYAVGNVFGERLSGFDVEKMRQSFGFGLRANSSRDHSFELLFAGGTDTFERGADLESFRFVFGSTAGF